MVQDKTLKKLFFGSHIIDNLRVIRITTFRELKKQCVQNRRFVPLKFPDLKPIEAHNLNWIIAKELLIKKLIPEIEVTKQGHISCYLHLIKKRSRKALIWHNIRSIGQLCDLCIENKSFKSLKGKKIGPRVNYEVALVLRHLHFLSEKEFLKVPLPSWKTRLLTDREIGPDRNRKLYRMVWSDTARKLIIHAVTLKFREMEGFKRQWTSITLGELVKTFVRINSNDNLVFYTKGHIGSHWYSTEWFNEEFESAFVEIIKRLQEFNYLGVDTEIV